MKLENVQIEIKNKEHYEAVKKRLVELGRWTFGEGFERKVGGKLIRIYIHSYKVGLTWDYIREQSEPSYPIITLDDLYSIEKEAEVKEAYAVIELSGNKQFYSGRRNTYDEAVEYIKTLDKGIYKIEKRYEVESE